MVLKKKNVKFACDVLYKDDKDVKNILLEAKSALQKAVEGIPPDNKTDIPPFLTPKFVLELLGKIMKESLRKIQKSFQELKSQGVEISFNNPRILMTLHNLKLEDLRRDILIEAGLDKFEDPAAKIFQYATQKYTADNADRFSDKLMNLERQHQKAMDALLKNSGDSDSLIAALGENVLESSVNIGRQQSLRNQPSTESKSELIKSMVDKLENEDVSKSHPGMKKLTRQVSSELKSALENKNLDKEQVNSIMDTLFHILSGDDAEATWDKFDEKVEKLEPKKQSHKQNEIVEKIKIEISENPSEDKIIEEIKIEEILIKEEEREIQKEEVILHEELQDLKDGTSSLTHSEYIKVPDTSSEGKSDGDNLSQ